MEMESNISATPLYFEKELSWLSFNERVLQEAKDQTNPIIERIRFLGIFSNNLDEFFKVRVADVKRRILLDEVKKLPSTHIQLLAEIQEKVLKLNEKFDDLGNTTNVQCEMERNSSHMLKTWRTRYGRCHQIIFTCMLDRTCKTTQN